MLTLRKSNERGFADHGWLKSFHSFSFAGYYDPSHMGYANLRVINDDIIAAGTGFGTHGHKDMEIITYVLEGALAHKDSIGNGAAILPGDVQRMSAGTGIMHSEFNHEKARNTHLLQIWIEPNKKGVTPSYEQTHFDAASKRGKLKLVASETGVAGSVKISADARMHAGLFDGSERAELALDPKRPVYVHLARGTLKVNGQELQAGDAAKLAGESVLELKDGREAEVLVFELAA
jgi:quercetin 2,3-dioxygenase